MHAADAHGGWLWKLEEEFCGGLRQHRATSLPPRTQQRAALAHRARRDLHRPGCAPRRVRRHRLQAGCARAQVELRVRHEHRRVVRERRHREHASCVALGVQLLPQPIRGDQRGASRQSTRGAEHELAVLRRQRTHVERRHSHRRPTHRNADRGEGSMHEADGPRAHRHTAHRQPRHAAGRRRRRLQRHHRRYGQQRGHATGGAEQRRDVKTSRQHAQSRGLVGAVRARRRVATLEPMEGGGVELQ